MLDRLGPKLRLAVLRKTVDSFNTGDISRNSINEDTQDDLKD